MFISLFLATVVTTSICTDSCQDTPQLSTPISERSCIADTANNDSLPTHDSQESKELQELIAIFTSSTETDTPEKIDTTQEITASTNSLANQNIESSPITSTKKKAITITNAIEPEMLAYKHWTGTYSPETFTISINGTEVAQGAQHTLPAETKDVDVQFYYSFMNGMRKGTKTVSYELHENITRADITFSWKDNWQVLLDKATAIKKVTT